MYLQFSSIDFTQKKPNSLLYHSVEKREIFFREISSVVTSLVKTLVSRNFCQKMRKSKLSKFPQRLYLNFEEKQEFPKIPHTSIHKNEFTKKRQGLHIDGKCYEKRDVKLLQRLISRNIYLWYNIPFECIHMISIKYNVL